MGAPNSGDFSGEAPAAAGSGEAETASSSSSLNSSSTTYETVADYIASLNGDGAWIEYDESANTATISKLSGFVAACKSPSKDVGAFDALDCSQAENQVFGDSATSGLHFDAAMAVLLANNSDAYAKLSGWSDEYPDAYEDDRELKDELGNSSDFRQQLYDPMCYLSEAYEECDTSTPAAHWRIRTGITQGDTALTTEINLALALAANERVSDVDFETVWGQGHTMAERTGSSTSNFIEWINACCK